MHGERLVIRWFAKISREDGVREPCVRPRGRGAHGRRAEVGMAPLPLLEFREKLPAVNRG